MSTLLYLVFFLGIVQGFLPSQILAEVVKFSFTKIVDTNDSIPDGTGNFTKFLSTSPALYNGEVAFMGVGSGNQRGIYVERRGEKPAKIVDKNSPVPEQPDFRYFLGFFNPVIENGKVAFKGIGNAGEAIYVSNGLLPPSRVVDGTMQVPGSSALFGGISDPSLNDGKVAFSANGAVWIYNNGLTKVVDTNNTIPGTTQKFSSIFHQVIRSNDAISVAGPDIENGQAVFRGSGTGDQGGIYLGNDSNSSPAIVVDTNDVAPGAEKFSPPDHTFRNSFGSPLISNGKIAFFGSHSGSSGIWIVDNSKTPPIQLIADERTRIPDPLDSVGYTTFSLNDPAMTFDNGVVAFTNGAGCYTCPAGTDPGIYSTFGGSLGKVIDVDETLDGKEIAGLSLGRHSLDGNSLVFFVIFRDKSQAIYIADATVCVDTDGDSLCDTWETRGIDIDGDGTPELNLPAMGADPKKKDIFVEIDYLDCSLSSQGCVAGDASHKPDSQALKDVIDAFARAPESITLHLKTDDPIPETPDLAVLHFEKPGSPHFTELKLGNPSKPCTGYFGTEDERTNPNCENILKAKKLAFRYAIFGHSRFEDRSSGAAEFGGNDFLITLFLLKSQAIAAARAWGTTFRQEWRDIQAAAFMHELGHTLGLDHGGNEVVNCKPNYLSVMNYLFQFNQFGFPVSLGIGMGHLIRTNRPLDYSRGDSKGDPLPPLIETALEEKDGISGPSGRLTRFGGLAYQLSGFQANAYIGPSSGPIDWNTNGQDSDSGVRQDISFIQADRGCPAGLSQNPLTGYNDWVHLAFNFRNSPYFADGATLPEDTYPSEPTDEDYLNSVLPGPDFDNDGIQNTKDNCPVNPNTDQADADSDGIGDTCDNCRTIVNPGQEDTNDNGSGDACNPVPPENCGNCVDDNGDGLVDLHDPQCNFIELTLKDGALSLDPAPAGDKLTLQGTFSVDTSSIDPSTEGVTINLTDKDGQIACFTLPPGAGWKVGKNKWTFTDDKTGALGTPTAKESLSIQYNTKKNIFTLKTNVKKTELDDPDEGDIDTAVSIGDRGFLNTQAWQLDKKGKKLSTPVKGHP
jgi:hypothetical protein